MTPTPIASTNSTPIAGAEFDASNVPVGSAIEVEYFCNICNIPFVVYHQTDTRNSHCCWCGSEVHETGLVTKLVGDDIVTYDKGVEIARRKKRGTVNLHSP
jgi:hypothetical protein